MDFSGNSLTMWVKHLRQDRGSRQNHGRFFSQLFDRKVLFDSVFNGPFSERERQKKKSSSCGFIFTVLAGGQSSRFRD